jgi:ABC-type dipeptide/oligopeptide/nickel transport system permease component
MGTYIARRILLMFPTLIGITFLVFMLVALSPGGIGASLTMAGGQMEATSRALQEAYLEDRYGLNDSPPRQYIRWLGRISPVKFGQRDLVTPGNEIISSPRPLREPPLWRWVTSELPTAERGRAIQWPDDAFPEDRARTYRRAANEYSQRRAGYVANTTLFQQAVVRWAQAAGHSAAITARGTLRAERLRNVEPDRTLQEWSEVEAAGEAMIAAYGRALEARREVESVFLARPFRPAGFAIIPGMVSVGMPDFGTSFSRSRPVVDLPKEALPVTLLLNLIAFPIIYLIAIPGGMLAAVRAGKATDIVLGSTFIALWSIPTVLAGVLAIGFLASNEYLGWFPVSGLVDADARSYPFLPATVHGEWHRGYLLDFLWHIFLPVLCLVYGGFAVLSKQTRAAMLDNFNADYVRTAKAKGVADRDVVFRHVFRNSLLPLITMFVTLFPALLSGSVIIENIFTIPGMGRLALDAINLRDREVILATTLMIGAVNLLALLLADILYAMADPRISYE